MEEVVNPSMEMVSAELSKQGIQCYIHDEEEDRIGFEVDLGEDMNFFISTITILYSTRFLALAGLTDEEKDEEHKYYRAEIHLKEGGKIRCHGLTKEQIFMTY